MRGCNKLSVSGGARRAFALSVGLAVALGLTPVTTPSAHAWGAAALLLAVGKSAAASAAQDTFGGRVLSVDQVVTNGRLIYKVKLLLDGGIIKIVTIDGETGKIL